MDRIAKEYAEALFALGCETGEESEIMSSLTAAVDTLRDNPAYLELLATPAIAVSERVHALEQAFDPMCHTHVVSLLGLLCERGYIRKVFDCADEYRRLLDARRSTRTAQVTSAIPLTEQQKEALILRLQSKVGGIVTLDCRVDASLLGGMIVELDGKVTDGSLRHRLQEIKEVMNR